MKYLVQATLKEDMASELFEEVRKGTLGTGSVAFGEYVRNMKQARVLDDGRVCWVEVCFCATPLNEERRYWEKYFDNITVEAAHTPQKCMDSNGSLNRACFACSCTEALERSLSNKGRPLIT